MLIDSLSSSFHRSVRPLSCTSFDVKEKTEAWTEEEEEDGLILLLACDRGLDLRSWVKGALAAVEEVASFGTGDGVMS